MRSPHDAAARSPTCCRRFHPKPNAPGRRAEPARRERRRGARAGLGAPDGPLSERTRFPTRAAPVRARAAGARARRSLDGLPILRSERARRRDRSRRSPGSGPSSSTRPFAMHPFLLGDARRLQGTHPGGEGHWRVGLGRPAVGHSRSSPGSARCSALCSVFQFAPEAEGHGTDAAIRPCTTTPAASAFAPCRSRSWPRL